jgi:DNA-binding transcriptional LysR family regulator
MLLNSTVEIALLNELPVNPEFASEPFRKEKLVVFAAPNHPLAKKKRLTFIGPSSSCAGDHGDGKRNRQDAQPSRA